MSTPTISEPINIDVDSEARLERDVSRSMEPVSDDVQEVQADAIEPRAGKTSSSWKRHELRTDEKCYRYHHTDEQQDQRVSRSDLRKSRGEVLAQSERFSQSHLEARWISCQRF